MLENNPPTARLPVWVLMILALNLEEELAVGIAALIRRDLQAASGLVDNAAAVPVGGHCLLQGGDVAIVAAIGVNARQFGNRIFALRMVKGIAAGEERFAVTATIFIINKARLKLIAPHKDNPLAVGTPLGGKQQFTLTKNFALAAAVAVDHKDAVVTASARKDDLAPIGTERRVKATGELA